MLSSKRIGLICVVLTLSAIAFITYMFIAPVEKAENRGVVTYENGQSIEFADSDYYEDFKSRSRKKINSGDGNVEITSSGLYELSGNINGSINVNAQGGGVVELVLNNAHITSVDSPAIYIEQAAKTVIMLAGDSENSITDSSARDDSSISGAIYSRDDLVICGDGKLTINANYADGIKANDSLKITGGNIDVKAVDEGINANDYIALMGGSVTVVSGGHGIKCANDEDIALGFIVLDGGNLNIQSEKDGIQASGDIYVNKTDALLSVADDAVHAEGTLFLNGGNVDVEKCTEGLEGKYITMNDGEYSIVSSDDGLNATGEGGGMMRPGGFGGRGEINGEVYLKLNGGTLYALVGGDGIDSNGAAEINGGFIEVYGPENNGNSTLDFDGGFAINGGTVIAAGSSGMAENPAESSKQNTIVVFLENSCSAGTKFSLKDKSGNVVAEGTSQKRFDWLCVSSPDIKTGENYTVFVNETEAATVTVSSVVTSAGERRRGGMFR